MHAKQMHRHKNRARAARGCPRWRGPAGSHGPPTSSTLKSNKPHLGGCAAASASAPPSPPSSGAAAARLSPSAASPARASPSPASPPGAPPRSAAGAAPRRGGLGQGLGAGGRSQVVARVLWSMKKVRPLASLRACAAAAGAHQIGPVTRSQGCRQFCAGLVAASHSLATALAGRSPGGPAMATLTPRRCKSACCRTYTPDNAIRCRGRQQQHKFIDSGQPSKPTAT